MPGREDVAVEAKARVLAHMRRLGREMVETSRSVSRSMGLNQTQLRAVDQLIGHGRLSPGELSHALGLSTGATTALIDNLEELGHLRRLPHPQDRRMVVLE
ncbi:MAG: MarR family transcriptional regulator, partial [Candidatus Dormibacteraeota bacterium]|nr:MarR family transcriptional regulator [Candidatus Dormibacteraeota bacterium]